MDLRVAIVALLLVGARDSGLGAPLGTSDPAPRVPSPESRPVQPRKIHLRIHPRVGDTLRMRFDQLVQSAGPAPQASPVASRSSAMHVMSRSVVEKVDESGTTVLTITDSAVFDAPGIDPRQVEAARRAMRGQWARMRVSPAGAMEMIAAPRDDESADAAGSAAITRLPGTLPETPVAVGQTWTRELSLPWGVGTSPFSAGGRVDVVFRLDSVTAGGALAYVSMHGALARSGVAQSGTHVTTSGTMTGRLLVDLRRGWMTDSRAEFAMTTTWMPIEGSKAKPMQLRVTITQSLHCND